MRANAGEPREAGRFILYCRVSNQEQEKGWSLAAQEASCRKYVESIGGEVAGVHVESGSGRNDCRPALASALEQARQEEAALCVWMLDRLGRNQAHLARIRESGCSIHIAERGRVLTALEFGIAADLAEDEAERLSTRIRHGLKEREKKTGMCNGGNRICKRTGESGILVAQKASVKARKEKAIMATIEPSNVIRVLCAEGMSLNAIARRLTAYQIPTPKGGAWTATRVKQLIKLHGIGQSQEAVEAEAGKERS